MSMMQKRFSIVRSLLLGVCLCGVAACSSTPRPKAVRPATVQAISNEQQVADVVSALEVGDVARARKLLKEMARRDPADRQVQTLLVGLDGDPKALLGQQSFAYTVQRGDRTTSLAQRFLGDRLKFYLLARYNGLRSAALEPGQVVRIPGAAPAPVVTPVVRPRPEIKPAVTAPPRIAPPPAANPALAGSLRGQSVKALDQGKVATAVVLLRRAKAADPGNALVARDLARAERLLATVRARK
jgi:hypothetical protein